MTTLISMLLPFFNDVVGILGAFGFWPLTVFFPIEMYISQKKIAQKKLFSIPAMMKKKTFNIFISSNYTQKENKENRAQILYLGQNQVHSKRGRQFPNLYLSCIELLSKKGRSNGQVQTKLQVESWMAFWYMGHNSR